VSGRGRKGGRSAGECESERESRREQESGRKGKKHECPGAGARTRGGCVGVGEPSRTVEALQSSGVTAS